MKSLATAALVGLAMAATAVPALSQPLPNSARLGMSLTEGAFTGPANITAFSQTEVYVLVDMDWGAAQNSQGLTAWEAAILLPDDPGGSWTVLGKELYPAGALNIGNNTNCIVGTGSPVRQLDANVPATLAKLTLGWFNATAPSNDLAIEFGPASPSSFPSNPRPAWVDENDRLFGFDVETGMGVNCTQPGGTEGPCPIATETTSWGAIKANR